MGTHYYGFRDKTDSTQVLRWGEEGPQDLPLCRPPGWEGDPLPYWGVHFHYCQPLAYSLLLDVWGQPGLPRDLYPMFAARYLAHVPPTSELFLDSEDVLRMVVVMLHGMLLGAGAFPTENSNGKGGS